MSAKNHSDKSGKLEIGGISFAIPEDFKLVKGEAGETFAFMRHKEYDLGVFVALIPARAEVEQFLIGLLNSATSKMFPKEQKKFDWKGVGGYKKISKYEKSSGAAQGFNQRVGVIAHYHLLVANGKEVFIGYVTEFGKGKVAAESFASGLGGGSGPGCNAAVELAFSITGERVDEENHPCAFSVQIGSSE